nr:MAG TPA: hypothetical protein [Caudoviricetes sp.]
MHNKTAVPIFRSGSGFIRAQNRVNLSYDKFVCDFNLTCDKW